MYEARLYLGGTWTDGTRTITMTDKYGGAPVGRVHWASSDQVGVATADLARAQQEDTASPYDRYRIMAEASRLLEERRVEFTEAIVTDSGFTVTDARREVDRAVQTLLLSGEEAKRLTGEMVPLGGAPGGSQRLAFTVRRPLGVVCALTPFNSPLNTVLHKLGPALGAGNAVVLKPSEHTPYTSELIVRLLLDAGLGPRLIALLHGDGASTGRALLEDPVPALYAFTGSTAVGEHIRRTVGLRRTQLELGSVASTVICTDADLARSVPLCVNAAFRKAGQVCTSIQRLYVERPVVEEVTAAIGELLETRTAGDPRDEDTFVGPLITTQAADRVQDWTRRAADGGATITHGGGRHGNVVEPTVLTDVGPEMEVMCQEVFGPVLSVRPFDDLDVALAEADSTPYGLAAGLFTADITRALTAARRLRMGAVHINETSSSRVDLMPYAGVKASGMGREGPHYAIQEMTEECLITLGAS
jgi:acyl-CoA reductase-like NAD-dependent aldehyde dehydrogenase